MKKLNFKTLAGALSCVALLAAAGCSADSSASPYVGSKPSKPAKPTPSNPGTDTGTIGITVTIDGVVKEDQTAPVDALWDFRTGDTYNIGNGSTYAAQTDLQLTLDSAVGAKLSFTGGAKWGNGSDDASQFCFWVDKQSSKVGGTFTLTTDGESTLEILATGNGSSDVEKRYVKVVSGSSLVADGILENLSSANPDQKISAYIKKGTYSIQANGVRVRAIAVSKEGGKISGTPSGEVTPPTPSNTSVKSSPLVVSGDDLTVLGITEIDTSKGTKIPSESKGAGTYALGDGTVSLVADAKEKYTAYTNSLLLVTGCPYTDELPAEVGSKFVITNYILVKSAASTVTVSIPYTSSLASKAASDSTADKTYVDQTYGCIAIAGTDGTVIAVSEKIDISKSGSSKSGTFKFENVEVGEEFVVVLLRSQGSGGFKITKIDQSYEAN